MARTGSRPVAGRPPLFALGITNLDFFMNRYYQTTEPRESYNFPLGSNLQHEDDLMSQADHSNSIPAPSPDLPRPSRRVAIAVLAGAGGAVLAAGAGLRTFR